MSYIPEWATHYKITSTEGLGPREYLEIEFFENYSWQHGHSILGMHPIADLAKDLAIADVCQQIKDKPLSERIAEAVRPTDTAIPKAPNTYVKPGVAKPDNINPSHYKTGEVECIDAIKSALTEEEYRGYLKGNIIKYTWRERMKGAKESLQKAAWYLERLIK